MQILIELLQFCKNVIHTKKRMQKIKTYKYFPIV